MTELGDTSYDKVPYFSQAYAQSHPDRLAATAKLFGMTPAPLGDCRVLELGCASGGNLIPMAVQLPGSSFLGIDLSVRQIADGKAIVEQLQLRNIELRQMDITAVDSSLGKFDYIIAHGVYSWVPSVGAGQAPGDLQREPGAERRGLRQLQHVSRAGGCAE